MGMLLNKGCDWMRSMAGECAQSCPRSGWFLELEEGGKVALIWAPIGEIFTISEGKLEISP
jgi:hypothetical protein